MSDKPVLISVTGHASRRVDPLRAGVRFGVGCEGHDPTVAHTRAARAVDELTALITAVDDRPDHPLKRWSLGQVRHSRHRPYNSEGLQLDFVYNSSADGLVTFRDLSAVAGFVDALADMDAVAVHGIDWSLTRKTTARHLRSIRADAVDDAHAKALTYARALGRRQIRPVEISDQGLLAGPPASAGVRMAGVSFRADQQPRIDLRPEPLVLDADVQARFEAV
ncbi:SIMPL domain-containing protein [Rhodococcus sp. D2-41]|uniref:SIMPL domain-containing protein n=1 Tax=Speluncibacter jeojiensis TaxID=2710754 RepID=A0A9X4M1W7_9ACTN|nr:SIMPL domain-containing protein [Rhodococcus sp. D2-41]MDG3012567.1 SIMPL domain-containing protein [Rhodococcus sp. D2-41]MDG3015314.1 SIMPL domain-containing protein [Corynebacteriales bacterium D3-21]